MKESLIEIRQDMPGFERFIGSWICQDNLNVVIDVGPARTVNRLIDTLAVMGLDRVDYVLLTHIHIDHAGGLAGFLEHYPMAKVICHEQGIEYLVEPSKLWASSKKVLGGIAKAYGPPKPVKKNQLIPHTEHNLKDLIIIETPGHAPHHLAFSYKERLFAGEAGGVHLKVNGMEYLRPAAPPRFFFDVCVKSIDGLLCLTDQPIRYAHFGQSESSHRLLNIYRNQLIQWNEVIHKEMSLENSDFISRCLEILLEKDPNLKAFDSMDPDVQQRELFDMTNDVIGFVGSIEKSEY